MYYIVADVDLVMLPTRQLSRAPLDKASLIPIPIMKGKKCIHGDDEARLRRQIFGRGLRHEYTPKVKEKPRIIPGTHPVLYNFDLLFDLYVHFLVLF